MGHLLLPFASTFVALGITSDLINYNVKVPYTAKRIFNDTDFVQNRTEVLDAAYHVFPGDKFPTSVFGLPIDLILNYQFGKFSEGYLIPTSFSFRNVDSVTIAVVAKYITAERSLKKDATLVPGWQKNIPKNHTHYVDKLYMGSRCHGVFRAESNVTGDVQILRKIITDVMGSSGQVTKDTLDLWKRTRKAIEESKDVRGKVTVSFNSLSFIDMQETSGREIESFLEYVPKLSQFVSRYVGNISEHATAVSYKELHDLDKRYPALKRNSETEAYLEKLHYRIEDLKSTEKLNKTLFEKSSNWTNEASQKLTEFQKMVSKNLKTLTSLASGNFSIYKEITNKDAFKSAFYQYESNLDKTTSSYYTALKKLYENVAVRCEDDFLTPTAGYLKVERNEVISKIFLFGNITKCQDYCLEDERCRAFGYVDIDSSHATIFSGKGQVCSIFYRSTSTATLIYPKGFFEGVQTYDRKCHYEWRDD